VVSRLPRSEVRVSSTRTRDGQVQVVRENARIVLANWPTHTREGRHSSSGLRSRQTPSSSVASLTPVFTRGHLSAVGDTVWVANTIGARR
jgi:hypothetical protein